MCRKTIFHRKMGVIFFQPLILK